jgi:hypothetical protein
VAISSVEIVETIQNKNMGVVTGFLIQLLRMLLLPVPNGYRALQR